MKGMTRHGAALGVLWALAILPAAAQDDEIPTTPQTFYIDNTHVGEEDGTTDRPFQSIYNALLMVLPDRGDTLIVRPGEYDENFLIPPGTTLRSELGPYETALVSNSDTPETILGLADDTALIGFRVGPSLGDGLVVLEGASAEVRNCVFVDTVRGLAVQNTGRLDAFNNTFFNNQVSLQGEAGAVLRDIRNNIFANDGVGILVDEGATLNSAYNNFDGFGPPVFGAAPGDTDYSRDSGFSDPENGLFHLRGASPLRDLGDPAAVWNDRDDTRNDLGADGGPLGEIDVLAPQVNLDADPQLGPAPLAVAFDASASRDDWGMPPVAWDFDISDGLSFDTTGMMVQHTYAAAGQYIAAVLAEDDRGNRSISYFPVAINVGGTPPLFLSTDRQAGGTPFTLNLELSSAAGATSYGWDLNENGAIDLVTQTAAYTYPGATVPGLYGISGFATDSSGRRAHTRIGITVAENPVLGDVPMVPGSGTTLRIDEPGSPLEGASGSWPFGSINISGRATFGEYPSSAFPFYPEGDLLRVVEIGPQHETLGAWATINMPIPKFDAEKMRTAHVFRFNAITNIWSDTGIRGVRVLNGDTDPLAKFQIAEGGAFAIVGERFPTGPFGCHQIRDKQQQSADGGSLLVFALAAGVMAAARRRR